MPAASLRHAERPNAEDRRPSGTCDLDRILLSLFPPAFSAGPPLYSEDRKMLPPDEQIERKLMLGFRGVKRKNAQFSLSLLSKTCVVARVHEFGAL